MSASALLLELIELKYDFSERATIRKKELLEGLEGRNLARAVDVHDLHEALCFLRAFPPDEGLRDRTGRMLRGFDGRADLQRFRKALTDYEVKTYLPIL